MRDDEGSTIDPAMPAHGGDLAAAEARYGRPAAGWLDLSTGINAVPYPAPAPAPEVWQRLPQPDAEAALLAAARQAYGVGSDMAVVAAPGTQALIQLLPALAPAGPVAVLSPTYSEHARVWRTAGREVREPGDLAGLAGAGAAAVVAVNPNNPDGRLVPPDALLAATADMRCAGGLLVVDEAFADVMPEISLCGRPARESEGMVVLRSFGKFFGLAGVRLGFAIGPPSPVARLQALLGPWAVSGPAIAIGTTALSDGDWIAATRADLAARAARLDRILARAGLAVAGGTSLFRLVDSAQARAIQERLARAGIWTRAFPARPHWLRIGVPGGEAAFARLDAALGAG
jgi:cobalamin biosynthetic protein CobC